jgi:hypothetical protein
MNKSIFELKNPKQAVENYKKFQEKQLKRYKIFNFLFPPEGAIKYTAGGIIIVAIYSVILLTIGEFELLPRSFQRILTMVSIIAAIVFGCSLLYIFLRLNHKVKSDFHDMFLTSFFPEFSPAIDYKKQLDGKDRYFSKFYYQEGSNLFDNNYGSAESHSFRRLNVEDWEVLVFNTQLWVRSGGSGRVKFRGVGIQVDTPHRFENELYIQPKGWVRGRGRTKPGQKIFLEDKNWEERFNTYAASHDFAIKVLNKKLRDIIIKTSNKQHVSGISFRNSSIYILLETGHYPFDVVTQELSDLQIEIVVKRYIDHFNEVYQLIQGIKMSLEL